jgi:hypothetical protein
MSSGLLGCTRNLSFSFRGCSRGFQQHGYLVHVVLVKVIAFAAAHEIAPFWNMMKRIETHRELRVLIRLLIVRDFEIENCTVLPNPCGSDSWEARIAMSSRFLLPPLLASDDRKRRSR